jgi:hypothetical protein
MTSSDSLDKQKELQLADCTYKDAGATFGVKNAD